MELAAAQGLKTLAFPAISCGVYGYPLDQACRIAVREARVGLQKHPEIERIVFVCFGQEVFAAYTRALASKSPSEGEH